MGDGKLSVIACSLFPAPRSCLMPDSHFTGDATIDLARADRCGFPEVVYGPGKRPDSIVTYAAAV